VSWNPDALAPVLIQSFGPSRIALYSTHVLYFQIYNHNPQIALTGIAFQDTLPPGFAVAGPTNVSNTCGGSVTAVPVSTAIAFSGGALAAQASCVISVDVKALKPGRFRNTSGPITSDQSGPGGTSAWDGLVVGPGVVRKAFAAATVPLGSTTSLIFTVSNRNPGIDLVNVGFSDDLPTGLQIASPNHLAGSCISDQGAAVTAAPGGHNITLWTLVLSGPASSLTSTSCTISVDVVAVQTGTQENVSGPVTATFDDGSQSFVAVDGPGARATVVVTP